MRLGSWVLAAVTAVTAAPGCSGGYSLPPTPCDEWCHATKGGSCPDYYNPASCVSTCESQPKDLAQCRPQLDAEIACFRTNPGAAEARCGFYDAQLPCAAEAQVLATCLGAMP